MSDHGLNICLKKTTHSNTLMLHRIRTKGGGGVGIKKKGNKIKIGTAEIIV